MSTQGTLTRSALAAAVVADNGAPTGTDGIAVPDPKVKLWSLEIAVTGTGALSFEGYLWGLEVGGTTWAKLGSGTVADIGNINGSTAITGTGGIVWRDVIQNLGYLERVYLEVLNLSGTSFSLSATLTGVEEN